MRIFFVFLLISNFYAWFMRTAVVNLLSFVRNTFDEKKRSFFHVAHFYSLSKTASLDQFFFVFLLVHLWIHILLAIRRAHIVSFYERVHKLDAMKALVDMHHSTSPL